MNQNSFFLKNSIIIILILYTSLTHANIKVSVVNVHDGDTITIKNINGQKYKLRLYGIDAPELDQPYGKAAHKYLKDLLSNKTLYLKIRGEDSYGRVLGTLYSNRKEINLIMIKDGYAWYYRRYSSSRKYDNAQKNAMKYKKGLWKDKRPTPPWVHRRIQREKANKPKGFFRSPIKGLIICLNPINNKITLSKDKCSKNYITIVD